jgi:hypothetical protein
MPTGVEIIPKRVAAVPLRLVLRAQSAVRFFAVLGGIKMRPPASGA